MLYKPTNPSPYNSVVDKPTETSPLTFTASCVSTSSISGMRLAIKDNTTEYYLPITDNAVSQCKTTSGIAIPYQSATFNSKESCSIKTSNFTRTDGLSNEAISKIIQPLTSYRWQVRLYQGSTDINIGCGFVQDVINFNNSSNPNRRILKVRPHTNMFMGKSQRDEDFGDNVPTDYNKGWNKSLTEYYDDKVVYQIQFSGKSYDILNYYYSKEPAYYVGTKPTDLISEKQYDEPLFAYIEIDIDDGDTIETGAEYTILTNYIDSNEYYFSCRQLGTLTFRGRDDSPISEFTSIDELDKNPDDHIYSPTHSNVQIKGSFDSKSGATINYYHATLYQVLSNGEDIQIHDSGYVYDSEVDYDCKDLLSGNTYKLVISVTDTYGNTVSKGVYIEPDCGAIIDSSLLTATAYPQHNSVIIDLSQMLSITGKESNPYEGSYTLGVLKGSYDNISDDYIIKETIGTGGGLGMQSIVPIEVGICEIAHDNTVSFSDIDGAGKSMKCEYPLISMTFRCKGYDNQTIFEFISDDGIIYTLTWETYRFHLCKSQYFTYTQPRVIIEEVDGVISYRTVRETLTQKVSIGDEYYSPYGNIQNTSTWATSVYNKMKSGGNDGYDYSSYDVPYLAYDIDTMRTGADSNDTDGSRLWLHTESVSELWWQVIVASGYWYMKCLNPPDGYNWERSE